MSYLNQHRRKQSKGEMLLSAIVLFLFGLWFAGMVGRDYYWQYQIKYYGIETKAYYDNHLHIRQKPLEPKRYFAYLTYQPLDGQESLISNKVEISPQDAERLQQKKPIRILYMPQNPQKVLPKNPRPAIIPDYFPWFFLLILFGSAFYEYLEWRKAK